MSYENWVLGRLFLFYSLRFLLLLGFPTENGTVISLDGDWKGGLRYSTCRGIFNVLCL
jgi:hypothetical protein